MRYQFKIKFLLILALGLATCTPLGAQSFASQDLGLEEGLPAQIVNEVRVGPKGFAWMATEGAGLVRFDGYRFQTFGNELFPVVNDLAFDTLSDQLWFYNDRNLWHYDGFEVKLAKVQPGHIAALASSPEGVWLQTDEALFLSSGDSLMRITETNFDARQLQCSADTLWSAGPEGLYYLKNQNWQLVHAGPNWQLIPGTTKYFLHRGQLYHRSSASALGDTNLSWQGALGIGPKIWLYGSDRLAYYKEGRFQRIELGEEVRILGLSQMAKGELVVRHQNGLTRLFYQEGLRLATTQPVYTGGKIEEDWLLATAQGPQIYSEYTGMLESLSGGLVLSMAYYDGQLYLGTERGLAQWKAGAIRPVANGPKDFVFDLQVYDQKLWLGTGTGLLQYDGQKFAKPLGLSEMGLATVFKLKVAADSSFWAATYTDGFYRWDGEEWRQLKSLHGLALDSLNYSTFYPIDKQSIWLGTLNDGLFKIDLNGKRHFSFSELEYAEVRDLIQVSDELWLGTNKGLCPLSELEARKQEGTGGDLAFFGPALTGNNLELYQGSQLLAGTNAGLFIFNPSQLKQLPEARVQSIELFKRNREGINNFATDSLPFLSLPGSLQLPYDYNYLRFAFGSELTFRPELLVYRYRLKGQSEAWTYSGQIREAIFSDLSPGEYQFEVQSRYPGEEWKGPINSYSFTIQPPLWTTWWFITLLVILFISIGAAIVYSQIKRIALQRQLQDTERKALRLQMNPHFIFNALDSISSFIFKKDPKMAVRYLNNFAKLMRHTLESSVEQLHPVETEVSILKNYLELEKLRFGGKFDYQIEVDEEIDYDIGLPPMLVQPHVENAILHGLKPRDSGGILKIVFELKDDLLCISVEDNGIGREKARALPHKRDHRSMATQINRDRIQLLKRAYGDRVDLRIIDKENAAGEATGTVVEIKLPAEQI